MIARMSEETTPSIERLLLDDAVEFPDQFVQLLGAITKPWHDTYGHTRPWFRGMAKASFSLEPSLLRYRHKNIKVAENNLSLQFKQYAARILHPMPTSDLELLTVMQHHGVPTRLLDWTENAFAALYFSVKEYEHLDCTDDAIVWVLEPLRLAAINGGAGIPFAHDRLLGPISNPLPFYPSHTSARLSPQRGTFTVHPFEPQHALLKLAHAELDAGRGSPLRGIRVAGHRRSLIRDGMLNAFGSGEFTFFPDLDGLARELRMREQLEGKG